MSARPILGARDRDEFVRQALDIVGREVARADVEKAFDYVQRMKGTRREDWRPGLRYGALTAAHRAAAHRAAAALKRVLVALRPMEGSVHFMDDGDDGVGKFPDLTELERWQRHFMTIAMRDVRPGSPLDARRRVAVKAARQLLEATGRAGGVTTTRGGPLDQLAATLWGEPGEDFQRYLGEFVRRERPRK